jgi:hypothetical protein
VKRFESCIYVGRLEEEQPAVYVTGSRSVEPLGFARRSFDWGTDAPDGGLALARALLTDASGAEPSADVCCRFADEIVRRLPPDGFALPRDIVNAWLHRVVTV